LERSRNAGALIERHRLPILWGLILIAAATRAALVFNSPRSYGYVWDFYHEGVIWAYEHGRLPSPKDCWECYQPPLLFACGVPFYALGLAALKGGAAGGLRLLSLLPMICAGFVIYFCRQILMLFRPSHGHVLLGTALALVFPCLFISSYGLENDIVLAALMSAFFYRLCLYHLRPGSIRWRDPVLMGILAGLSALTKYPGLLTLITAGIVMSPRLVLGSRRRRTARDLLIIAAVAVAICGWHYARNMRLYRAPFLAAPGYSSGIEPANVARFRAQYDLLSFQVRAVVDLYRPDNPGALTDFPVYRSVFSTLHALAWSDMSFYSVASRHGWRIPARYGEEEKILLVAQTPASEPRVPPYPAKSVRPWLVELVLRLGVFPTLLALIGLAATFRRCATWPLLAYACASLAVYAWWFFGQPAWALKTKYILFLLPAYIAYVVMGLKSVYRRDRRLGHAAAAFLIAAILACEAYLCMFALG
jgi:hypothetical protein